MTDAALYNLSITPWAFVLKVALVVILVVGGLWFARWLETR